MFSFIVGLSLLDSFHLGSPVAAAAAGLAIPFVAWPLPVHLRPVLLVDLHVPTRGIEPRASVLSGQRSATELGGASDVDGIRTRIGQIEGLKSSQLLHHARCHKKQQSPAASTFPRYARGLRLANPVTVRDTTPAPDPSFYPQRSKVLYVCRLDHWLLRGS